MKSYFFAYLASLILMVAMYFAVTHSVYPKTIVVVFALAQLFIQSVYFLGVGKETKPYWNFIFYLFMLLIVLILVFGTLWIMYNLNYRME